MRYALVSDIHANLEALRAVFERIAADDTVLCLGDSVGYGPNPNECLALLRARGTTAILGNHDVGAIDNHGLAYFNAAARTAIEWTQTVLEPDHAAWLDGLAYEFRTPDFLLVHGAPVEYFTYILDKSAAQAAFAATDAPLIFVGHTHIADYYWSTAAGELGHRHMQQGGRLELEAGTRYLINVGSVGQPRDLNPDSSFAFYDPAARAVEWVRVPYAFERTQVKIEAAGLPAALAQRLAAGR